MLKDWSRVVSVKDPRFGAKGDGVTDDTASIQEALTFAGLTTGGNLFFPPGNYVITSQINILASLYAYAHPFSATIYMQTPNTYGLVIGDGTEPVRGTVYSTIIDGLQFAPLPSMSVSTSGAAIRCDRANGFQIRNCSIVGRQSGNTIWNGIEVDRSLHWVIDNCLIAGFLNRGITAVGAADVADNVSGGHIDRALMSEIDGDAIYLGDYTVAVSISKPEIYSCGGWAIRANVAASTGATGFNFFIEEPDIEVTPSTGMLGGVYAENCQSLSIVGGWFGGDKAFVIDASSDTCKATGTLFNVNDAGAIPVRIAGPACSIIGCDITGDAASTPTGIEVSGTANDTNIVGGRIRQFTTAAIAYSGTPARCLVDGVNFTNNTADNITGDNYATGPIVRDCVTDHSSALTAASALTPKHGHHRVIVTGATAINTITPLGLDSILTIQAGVGGITVNHSASISLNGAVNATIPANSSITLICTGTAWIELCRNYALAGAGTVTSFAFTNGGGFTGSVTNATTTPTLSLTPTAQTGTGTTFVMQTGPTLTTPVLGVATATSINKVAITAPATSATLTIADGKTLTASKTLALDGTDGTTHTFPSTTSTLARTDAAQTFTGTQTFSGLIDASGASAGQVKFPATQNASANANTLDDYDEATTTPTPTAGTGTFTSVSATVHNTKIGNRVFIDILVSITTNGTAGQSVKVPLPYTPAFVIGGGGVESAATGKALGGYFNTDGNAYIFLYDGTYPGANGRDLRFSGHYYV